MINGNVILLGSVFHHPISQIHHSTRCVSRSIFPTVSHLVHLMCVYLHFKQFFMDCNLQTKKIETNFSTASFDATARRVDYLSDASSDVFPRICVSDSSEARLSMILISSSCNLSRHQQIQPSKALKVDSSQMLDSFFFAQKFAENKKWRRVWIFSCALCTKRKNRLLFLYSRNVFFINLFFFFYIWIWTIFMLCFHFFGLSADDLDNFNI